MEEERGVLLSFFGLEIFVSVVLVFRGFCFVFSQLYNGGNLRH